MQIIISNTVFQDIPQNYKAVNNYSISKSASYEKLNFTVKSII